MSESANDPMDQKFEEAIAADWHQNDNVPDVAPTIGTLASHVSIWRSRANYWRGKCEGQSETIAYLKSRVTTLEERADFLGLEVNEEVNLS